MSLHPTRRALLLIVALALLAALAWAAACAGTAPEAEPQVGPWTEAARPPGDVMNAQLNAAVLRRYAEALEGTISPEVLPRLSELYASNVRFRDPLKDLRGFDDLRAYYAEFLELAEGGTFTIDRWIESEGEAALTWTMCLPPTEDDPKEDPERRCFGGMSHLILAPDGEAITAQRDYFDLGEAVYEQVSVLRWIHRRVKARF